MNIANTMRKHLIRCGKLIPFVLCAVIMFGYIECVTSLYYCEYVLTSDVCYINTPISFAIASYFEYDYLIVAITLILSLSIQACLWNRLAILYLALHLLFKRWVESVELEPHIIYILCFANIIICSYLIYKGLKTINQ
jgi:hypothetical protein